MTRIFTLWLLLFAAPLMAQVQQPDSSDYLPGSKDPIFLTHPSSWLQRDINRLNTMELSDHLEVDTLALRKELQRLDTKLQLIARDFYTHVHALNLRTIYDLKMEVNAINRKVKLWQKRVRRWNDELVTKALQVEKISAEIRYFEGHADSLIRETYAHEVLGLAQRQLEVRGQTRQVLERYTRVEEELNNFSGRVYEVYNDTDEALRHREMYLLHRDLPPIWRSGQQDYAAGFRATVKTSFLQSLDNIKFYAESSLARIVLFRILIFLLCLVPLRMFKKKKMDTPTMYLGKYPSLASTVLGMTLAPVIFIDAPHSFLEMIFIFLTALVGYLTWKEHPYLNKKAFSVLITSFFLMFLLNFFVTATFLGRIIASLSIFLLIPLYVLFREIPGYPIKRKKAMQAFIVLMGLHILAGWVFTVTGNYTLGIALILVAFETIILSMMFYVAVHSLLDYLMILCALFNARNTKVRLNPGVLYNQLRPLLILCSVLLVLIAYLMNTNMYDTFLSEIGGFLWQPHMLGDWSFTVGSIVLFLVSVFLAFYLAGLIRNIADAVAEDQERKSHIGGYLMLGRFLIICTGVMLGVMASGVSLSSFTIVLGAIGVGIGFGLQHIASNVISGLIIVFEKPFVVGDRLELDKELGRVKEIGLRATRIAITDGSEVLIPNGNLLNNNLKNWTLTNMLRRLQVDVPADQEEDHQRVSAIIRDALQAIPEILHDPAPIVEVAQIHDTSVQYSVYFWIYDSVNRIVMKGKVLGAIHEQFRKNNINYPRQDFYLNPDR